MAKAVIKPAGLRVAQHLVGAAGAAAGIQLIARGALGVVAQVLGASGQALPVGLGMPPIPEAHGTEAGREGEQAE